MPSGGHISLDDMKVRSNKDGWIMFVLDDYLPIIVNPFTGARLEDLPSLYTLLDSQHRRNPGNDYDFVLFLSDNLVAFAECYVCHSEDDPYHILATASQGADEWSFVDLPFSSLERIIRGIVFHEADRKFYAIDTKGDVLSFCLGDRKVSTLAAAESSGYRIVVAHLVSDGTNLLQVRKSWPKEFDIFKYCPDEDMWVKMINLDLGNNSLFIDLDRGAMLLPLPPQGGDGYLEMKEEERPRKNCIYFTHYENYPPEEEEEEERCVYRVRVYDVSKGTVENCFSTTIPSNYCRVPIMWFTPSLSVRN